MYQVKPDKDKTAILEEGARNRAGVEIHTCRKKIQSVIWQDAGFDKTRTEFLTKNHLRIIHKNRLGYFAYNHRVPVKQMMEYALLSSRQGIKCGFEFPKPEKYQTPQVYEQKVANLSLDNMKQHCRKFREYVQQLDQNITCDVTCETEVSETELVNSNGLALGYKKTGFYFAVWVRKKTGTRMTAIYDTDRYPYLNDMRALADRVVKELNWGKREFFYPGKKSCLPVLFAPNVANSFLNTLLAMMCAQTIANGESLLHDKLGEKIFGANISIYDNGTTDGLMQSAPFDDEGIPTQVTPLIEKGVFKNYINDLYYAALLKTKPTGNGRKVKGRTMAFHNNIILQESSDVSFDRMLQEIFTGIYIGTAVVNCNIRGDFTVIPKNCYQIDRGRITGLIQDKLQINGNLPALFNNIALISREKKLTKHDMLLPYIASPGLQITWC